MPKAIDITGQRVGRLVAIQPTRKRAHGKVLWLCLCECGKRTLVPAGAFRRGRIHACKHHKSGTNNPNYRHGFADSKNQKAHPLYEAWCQMHQRCRNPSHPRFKDYGGRGINVYKRWNNFAAYLAYVGERPHPSLSLDRIDNNKGYFPGNVRWATSKEQRANSRSPRKK